MLLLLQSLGRVGVFVISKVGAFVVSAAIASATNCNNLASPRPHEVSNLGKALPSPKCSARSFGAR
eukprot:scaffold257837_cov33-Tisochrysis_lutea.AAC.4